MIIILYVLFSISSFYRDSSNTVIFVAYIKLIVLNVCHSRVSNRHYHAAPAARHRCRFCSSPNCPTQSQCGQAASSRSKIRSRRNCPISRHIGHELVCFRLSTSTRDSLKCSSCIAALHRPAQTLHILWPLAHFTSCLDTIQLHASLRQTTAPVYIHIYRCMCIMLQDYWVFRTIFITKRCCIAIDH